MRLDSVIFYKGGYYKYQLSRSYRCQTDLMPAKDIVTEYIHLYQSGILLIAKGYAWDGPSGPAIDTLNFMRGSLVHDAIYQLMREGHLPQSFRAQADLELKKICLEDGMSKIRAWWVHRGVRLGAGPAADPKHKRRVLIAP